MKEFHDERLHRILQYKRGHESATEQMFIETFLADPGYLEGMRNYDDAAYIYEIPLEDGTQSKTMFSCHIDTVHRTEGMQKIKYDNKTKSYYKKDGEPLGADDGAGIWLMLEMIDAGVPGSYVFHRGEERGGIGSSYMADNLSQWLKFYDRAIAFDRRGSTSVITHQAGGRCCSDTFAQALADALNAANDCMMYIPDDTGVFTDTANYTELIPECTNIACGYQNEHTGNETLHLPTLFALRDACLKLDWESLPTKRDPSVRETVYRSYVWTKKSKLSAFDVPTLKSVYDMSRDEMIDMAYEEPELFVDLLREELHGEYDVQDDQEFDESIWPTAVRYS